MAKKKSLKNKLSDATPGLFIIMSGIIFLAITAGILLFYRFRLSALLIFIFVIVISSVSINSLTGKINKKGKKIDYRAIFIISLAWLLVGFFTHNAGLWTMGIAFLAAGLISREKQDWPDLLLSSGKTWLAIVSVFTAFALAGVIGLAMAAIY